MTPQSCRAPSSGPEPQRFLLLTDLRRARERMRCQKSAHITKSIAIVTCYQYILYTKESLPDSLKDVQKESRSSDHSSIMRRSFSTISFVYSERASNAGFNASR